jgi:proteic killer suppression protein
MRISFSSRKLQKRFESEKDLVREYGSLLAKKIIMRMAVLRNAPSLVDVPHTPPDRRHQLSGKRDGEFAVDLVHPHRLVFTADYDETPRMADGGVDLEEVKAITIIEVIDYH